MEPQEEKDGHGMSGGEPPPGTAAPPQQPAACRTCGAPATDRDGITQCSADVTHIHVHDLAAAKGPIVLRRRTGSLGPRPRPDGLTEGERTAIGWARERSDRWGQKGRGVADLMRQQFPWLDDAELARIALYFGTVIEYSHRWSCPDLDVASWAQVLKAAAVELASTELDEDPG